MVPFEIQILALDQRKPYNPLESTQNQAIIHIYIYIYIYTWLHRALSYASSTRALSKRRNSLSANASSSLVHASHIGRSLFIIFQILQCPLALHKALKGPVRPHQAPAGPTYNISSFIKADSALQSPMKSCRALCGVPCS